MRVYLDTGIFIDYLSARGGANALLRSSERRGRAPADIATDAERLFEKVAGHLEARQSSCGGDEFDTGSVGKQPLEEAQVRRVVLDAQHEVACGGDDGVWQRIVHVVPIGSSAEALSETIVSVDDESLADEVSAASETDT